MSLASARSRAHEQYLLAIVAFLFACTVTPLALAADNVEVRHKLGVARVPVQPKRVVTFDLSVLDSIDRLGAGGIALAIPKQTLPPYLAKYKSEDVVDAGGMKEPNLERIYEFQPDVIFFSARQTDYYDKFAEIAPTVYMDVDYGDFLGSFERNMSLLGDIFRLRAEADNLSDAIIEQAKAVAAKARDGKYTGLVVMVNDGAISVYGPGSRFGIIHDVLGVTPADPEIRVSTHGQSVDFEYLAKIDPDILFVINRNAAIGSNGGPSKVLDNDMVKNTRAGKTGKIVSLDSSVWYLSGAGLESLSLMLDEIDRALDN